MVLKPYVKVVLVDGRHIFAALKILEFPDGQHEWNVDVLRVILLEPQSGVPESAREIVLNGRSRSNLSWIVLTERSILDTISTLLIFSKTFDIDFIFTSCNAKTKTIPDDHIASNFLNGLGHSPCMRHVRVAKFMIPCPLARDYSGDTR